MPDSAGFVEPIALSFPRLPEAMDGLRIAHVSDVHARGPRPRQEQIIDAVASVPHDLLALTGDVMVKSGDEPAALEFLTQLVRASRAKLGVMGVWGNHDTDDLRRQARSIGVRWLVDSAWAPADWPITVLGVGCGFDERLGFSGDMVRALREEAKASGEAGRFRLLLSHMPIWLPSAAASGIDLMLCGHTHAGQCRLPTGRILYNATPRWPLGLSSGLIQRGHTRCLISRGLGEVYVSGLRLFCSPQLPIVTLRRG